MTGSGYKQLNDSTSNQQNSMYSSASLYMSGNGSNNNNNSLYASAANNNNNNNNNTTNTPTNFTSSSDQAYNFDPNASLAPTSSFSQQFQDFQSVSPERKQAIDKFSNRLKTTILLLAPMLIIVTFTPFWWSTFMLLSLLGCVTVYYRAANKNQRLSVIAFLGLLALNELRSIVIIIYQFVKIIHLSKIEIATMVIAFFDVIVAGPLNMYGTYWLLKSIQLDVYFLSQPPP